MCPSLICSAVNARLQPGRVVCCALYLHKWTVAGEQQETSMGPTQQAAAERAMLALMWPTVLLLSKVEVREPASA